MGEKWRTQRQHWIGTLCVVLLDGREVDRMDGNTVAALAGSWIGTRCGGEVDGDGWEHGGGAGGESRAG